MLGERIQIWTARRQQDRLNSNGLKHRVERGAELGAATMQDNGTEAEHLQQC
jgi:hypothetical protein